MLQITMVHKVKLRVLEFAPDFPTTKEKYSDTILKSLLEQKIMEL